MGEIVELKRESDMNNSEWVDYKINGVRNGTELHNQELGNILAYLRDKIKDLEGGKKND